MEKQVIYISNDGKKFNDENECLEYEAKENSKIEELEKLNKKYEELAEAYTNLSNDVREYIDKYGYPKDGFAFPVSDEFQKTSNKKSAAYSALNDLIDYYLRTLPRNGGLCQ